MDSQIKVLLAEDHTIVRKGIRSLLDDEASIQVVGEAEDGREAIDKSEQLAPDVVLMDIAMPRLNGLESTRQIKKKFPDMKVLVLSMYTNEEYILQFLQAGASGYLIKHSAPTELITAIKAVHSGDVFLSPTISRTVVAQYLRQATTTNKETNRYENLSPREREILQLVAEGYPNRDIAAHLHLSVKTIATHKANLLEKLGIHNTTELIKYAIRKGIISLDN